jgi:DNA-binding transcriptional LysR family regulator
LEPLTLILYGPREGPSLKPTNRYKEIQLAQLRSFCLVGTEGNFSTAAKSLDLSTSTVWQQVRALERELKVTLLRRKGRLIELTPEGQLLLEMVQPHVSGLDSLRHFFEARRKDLPKEVTLASGAYLFANHLPRPIQEFRATHPGVRVNLRIAAWSGIRRLMERREADIAIMASDVEEPRSGNLEYEHLFDEQFCLMTPAGHRLSRLKRVTPHDLIKYPLIVPPLGGVDRRALDRLFQKHDLADRVQTAMVSNLVDVTKRCVALGVGVALMYVPSTMDPSIPGLSVRVFDPEMEVLPIVVAVRKGAYLPDDVQDFRQTVLRHFSKHDGAREQSVGPRTASPGRRRPPVE